MKQSEISGGIKEMIKNRWKYVKSKVNLFRVLTITLCLLLTLSIIQVLVLAASSLEDQNQIEQQDCICGCSMATSELSTRDEFIAKTYFSHNYYVPDNDETLELLQGHVRGQNLLTEGKFDDAVALFETLIEQFPDARHANEGLAIALKERFNNEGNQQDLYKSTEYFIKAINKAIQVHVLPVISMQVGSDLAKLGETETLNRVFQELEEEFPDDPIIALEYAQGLAIAKDSQAEKWFEKAVKLGNSAAPIEYGEWLLDQGKYSAALNILDPKLDPYENQRYFRFLRGYALERLGQKNEAQAEYNIVRKQITNLSTIQFNNKYKIVDSEEQKGLNFGDNIQPEISCTGMTNLRKMVQCEAGGESKGGKRAVAWVARNRVFNGSRDCVTVDNSGSDNCSKYNSVVTQSGQFVINCGTTPSQESIDAAEDVWAGLAPEPNMQQCKGGGSYSGTACEGTCKNSSYQGGYANGDMMFYSTTKSCSSTHPSASCTSGHGKVCGNGGSDHCFYYVPNP